LAKKLEANAEYDFSTDCTKETYLKLNRELKKSEDTQTDEEVVYYPWDQENL
jgi:hypothetical protein